MTGSSRIQIGGLRKWTFEGFGGRVGVGVDWTLGRNYELCYYHLKALDCKTSKIHSLTIHKNMEHCREVGPTDYKALYKAL